MAISELIEAHDLEKYGLTDAHLEAVDDMAEELVEIATLHDLDPNPPNFPIEHRRRTNEGTEVGRAIVYDLAPLKQGQATGITVIGELREGLSSAKQARLEEKDLQLRNILASDPEAVASYQSRLPLGSNGEVDLRGNWVNQVVPKAGIGAFAQSEAHQEAIRMARDVFNRLTVIFTSRPGGILSGNPLQVTRVTHHDYRG